MKAIQVWAIQAVVCLTGASRLLDLLMLTSVDSIATELSDRFHASRGTEEMI